MVIDWSISHELIVSGGEEGIYCIWDIYGRIQYQSMSYEVPITAVNWSGDGRYFIVGLYNMILLCDKIGWIHKKVIYYLFNLFNN